MAMASPPSVIVLRVSPIHCTASTAVSNDSGIAVQLMTEVRQSNRNRNRTTSTIAPPISSA
jgi:hypothetical protein